MTVFGVVIGRLRTGITVISRPKLRADSGGILVSPMGSIVQKSALFNHSSIPPEKQPDEIVGFARRFLDEVVPESNYRRGGMISIPIENGRSKHMRILELVKLWGIVRHELSSEYSHPVVEVSMQQIRNQFGIKSSSAGDTKRILSDLFKTSGCVFENPGTNTSLQCLSESWGVARLIDRRSKINEIREAVPETIEKIRNSILNNRKIFDTSKITKSTNRKEELSTVINDLLEQEIDRQLVKRFNL